MPIASLTSVGPWIGQAVIVILTAEDRAGLLPEMAEANDADVLLRGQPRQNVILEAGLAMGADRSRNDSCRTWQHPPCFRLRRAQRRPADERFAYTASPSHEAQNAGCDIDESASDWIRTEAGGDFEASVVDWQAQSVE